MMLLLGGAVLGIVGSIIANLVTPYMGSLWAMLLSLKQRGHEAQVRQQLKVLQSQLDQLNARKVAPEKDLYLELFQWSLGIFAFFVAGVVCAFLAMTSQDVTDLGRRRLFSAAQVFFIATVVASVMMVNYSRELTAKGTRKKTAKLEADIAKLTTR